MTECERRDLFKAGAAATAGLALAGLFSSSASAHDEGHDHEHPHNHLSAKCYDQNGRAVLPPLEYDYNALEPHIDEQTMRLHHDKHHQGYVDGYNKALDALANARETGDFSQVDLHSRKLALPRRGPCSALRLLGCHGPWQGRPAFGRARRRH
jgi:hypothetical protein